MLEQVKREFEKYRIDNAAIQDIRRRGNGVLDTGKFILVYSNIKSSTFMHASPSV
jgi:hypothetical protein